MNQINHNTIAEKEILKMSPHSEIQQVGIDLSVSEEVRLKPGSSYNVLFNETVELPSNIYATFNIRSSFSRRGVFASTGIYDPGYVGSVGCTVYNMGEEELVIPKNERVGQMLFLIADAASLYRGQWQNK